MAPRIHGHILGAENLESRIPAAALPVTFLVVLVGQGSPHGGQELPRMSCRQALEKEDSPARVPLPAERELNEGGAVDWGSVCRFLSSCPFLQEAFLGASLAVWSC